MVWELLDNPSVDPRQFTVTSDLAAALLAKAVAAAKDDGIVWRDKPLVLKPLQQLVELVRQSQSMAAANGAQEEA